MAEIDYPREPKGNGPLGPTEDEQEKLESGELEAVKIETENRIYTFKEESE